MRIEVASRLCGMTVGLVLLAGCGSSGPEQYHLSGRVTFQGQPVQGGMIYLEPAEGNTGHTGYATISAGQFNTAAPGGKGHVGGKIAARIEPGGDPATANRDDNAPPPERPFHAWQEILDLPRETSTRDFVVPDDANKVVEEKRPVNVP